MIKMWSLLFGREMKQRVTHSVQQTVTECLCAECLTVSTIVRTLRNKTWLTNGRSDIPLRELQSPMGA